MFESTSSNVHQPQKEATLMVNRKWVLTAFGAAILGLVVAASGEAWGTANKTTHLTFSGPFALPGITLPAGAYTFELADPDLNLDIVRVRSRDRSKVHYAGFTKQVRRPANLPAGRMLTFGEVAAGTPPPVAAWYPDGNQMGHQFIYRP
jgi:hypothetical protein